MELDAFGEPAYPIFLFRQAIDLWPKYVWVATYQHELAAYVMLAPAADNLDVLSLMSFGIATQHQGKGLGRRFLAKLQQELRQTRPSLERVWLTVGTGWQAWPDLGKESGLVLHDGEVLLPAAEDMLPIACQMFAEGKTVAVEHAEPVYLRNNVAWKKLPGKE